MLKQAILICPRCKKSNGKVIVDDPQKNIWHIEGGIAIKEDEPFPNKCDVCGSTNVMSTHVITNIMEPDEIDEAKKNKIKIDRASRAAAEAFAKANA